MKFIIIFLLINAPFLVLMAQKQQFTVFNLSLPQEIEYYENQFSGLYINNGKLFMLSESRLQEGAEGKLYAINLTELERKMNDTSYVLPYKKYPIYHLDALKDKIDAAGQKYEGLEGIIIDNSKVVLSVETDTPSPNCYMLTGLINDTAVILDTDFLLPINKPETANGSNIYNASFEAVAKKDHHIFAFFEFNYFSSGNYVYQFNNQHWQNNSSAHQFIIEKLPFRVTDITYVGNDHFTAINYFYNGEGDDSVYRTPINDRRNSKLIKSKTGYKNYCRLIDIKLKHKRFKWKPLWDFPQQYTGYNWEGIAAYKNGYFIINDKYTPKRPYASALIFLRPVLW